MNDFPASTQGLYPCVPIKSLGRWGKLFAFPYYLHHFCRRHDDGGLGEVALVASRDKTAVLGQGHLVEHAVVGVGE